MDNIHLTEAQLNTLVCLSDREYPLRSLDYAVLVWHRLITLRGHVTGRGWAYLKSLHIYMEDKND